MGRNDPHGTQGRESHFTLNVQLALIVETWPPLEGTYFSLPHISNDFSLLPEIRLSIILANYRAVLGSLNSTSPFRAHAGSLHELSVQSVVLLIDLYSPTF